MPRTISALAQLQKKARQLAVNLRKEIRSKETELGQLMDEERKLSALVGGPAAAAGMAPVPRGGRARINWGDLLEKMPREFTASEVRRVRGLKDKRDSEIFAAITRWIEAGSVKRKERGVYERVQPTQKAKKTGSR